MLCLTVLLGFALAGGAYAGQGQSGFGGVSGEASSVGDVETGPPAQPGTPIVSPKKSESATPSEAAKKPTPKKKKAATSASDKKPADAAQSATSPDGVSKKKSQAASSDTDVKKTAKPAKTAKTAPAASASSQKQQKSTASEAAKKPSTAAQPVPAASPEPPMRSDTIHGEVLKIMGDSYIVKDVSGKNVRFQVDKTTKLSSNISAHDMVIVHSSEMISDKSSSDKAQSPKSVWHADSIEKQ
jgi:uncharacterized protein YdeI (BOF family)